MAPRIPDGDLGRFGITPEDERIHPHDPSQEWWNESYFWDWFDERGERAGHCRFGMHPNQARAWLWLFLYDGEGWTVIEEPRLPLSSVSTDGPSYESFGLAFSWRALDPLRKGELSCRGFGRVVSGPRAGLVLPVGVELVVEGVAPPHSPGRNRVAAHSSEGYDTSRFEQPTSVAGSVTIGSQTTRFEGRGERDHSWGPRPWNMEWQFLVLNGEDYRMQCAAVDIPGVPRIGTGYLHREESASIGEVDFDRVVFDDANVTKPVRGPIAVVAEDGSKISGTIEPISAAEMDITHCFDPPERSVYRRALVRFTPDASCASSAPAMGWFESNRFEKDPS